MSNVGVKDSLVSWCRITVLCADTGIVIFRYGWYTLSVPCVHILTASVYVYKFILVVDNVF